MLQELYLYLYLLFLLASSEVSFIYKGSHVAEESDQQILKFYLYDILEAVN